jgi:hypothetical protein
MTAGAVVTFGAIIIVALTANAATAAEDRPPPPARYAVELIVFRNLDQSRNTPEIPASGSLIADSPLELIPSENPDESFISSLDLGIAGFDLTPDAQSGLLAGGAEQSQSGEEIPEVRIGFYLMSPRAEYPDFVPIDIESMSLGNIYSRMETLGAYEPIAHLGWVQAAEDAGSAVPYRLKDKPVRGDSVTGTITLYKARYLHLALDLSLDEYRTDPQFYTREIIADMRTTGRTNHKLQESRRIREPSSHYFDHPLFGVIARIQKIKPPSPGEEADPG